MFMMHTQNVQTCMKKMYACIKKEDEEKAVKSKEREERNTSETKKTKNPKETVKTQKKTQNK